MPGVSRLGDVCTGHGCFPSRPSTGASPNVFVNGIPVHRQGDSWAPHCCVTCHGSVLAAGSPNVFVNGMEIARIGDPRSLRFRCGYGVWGCVRQWIEKPTV